MIQASVLPIVRSVSDIVRLISGLIHVAYFLEAIINAHDRSEFEIFCYSDVIRPDDVTRTFSRSVDRFTNIAGIDNTAVAEQIRRDKIDILVDLAGHTAGYRDTSLFHEARPDPGDLPWLP